jgi:prepilin-type N-terminal cleavage/methylation domain-containing protein/prepilin-type processing-associated H-X9-DG protein
MKIARSKHGFTLIELLVVIAVIALLLAILMPALTAARKQGRTAACLSQLKNWSLIWQMYFDNHNGRMPDVVQGLGLSGAGWHRGFWVSCLRPGWGKRPKILFCPSATKPPADNASHGGIDRTYMMPEHLDVVGGLRASYSMNLWVNYAEYDVQGRPKELHWQNQNQLRRTGEIPLFMDSMWRGGGPSYIQENDYIPNQENGGWSGAGYEMQHFAFDRHGGGINTLFLDGSARKVRVRQLWHLRWHKGFDTRRADRLPDSWWPEWIRR